MPARVHAPTLVPPPGEFNAPQEVILSCTEPDATIHYTVDGSPPTTDSPKYTKPISVSKTTFVQAFATAEGLGTVAEKSTELHGI